MCPWVGQPCCTLQGLWDVGIGLLRRLPWQLSRLRLPGAGEMDEGAMAWGSMEQTVGEPGQSYHGAESGVLLIGGFAAGAVTPANLYTLTSVAPKTVSENADSLDVATIPNTKRLRHYRGRMRRSIFNPVIACHSMNKGKASR